MRRARYGAVAWLGSRHLNFLERVRSQRGRMIRGRGRGLLVWREWLMCSRLCCAALSIRLYAVTSRLAAHMSGSRSYETHEDCAPPDASCSAWSQASRSASLAAATVHCTVGAEMISTDRRSSRWCDDDATASCTTSCGCRQPVAMRRAAAVAYGAVTHSALRPARADGSSGYAHAAITARRAWRHQLPGRSVRARPRQQTRRGRAIVVATWCAYVASC